MNNKTIHFPRWKLNLSPMFWCSFHRSVPADGRIDGVGPLCTSCLNSYEARFVSSEQMGGDSHDRSVPLAG